MSSTYSVDFIKIYNLLWNVHNKAVFHLQLAFQNYEPKFIEKFLWKSGFPNFGQNQNYAK